MSTAPDAAEVEHQPAGLLLALAALPDPRRRRGIRHRLVSVVAAAAYAVVAGRRSYAVIGEWVADVPDDTVTRLGIDPARRPSEAMIRRHLRALDPDQLSTVIAVWLTRPRAGLPAQPKQAIAVDGKTLRGLPLRRHRRPARAGSRRPHSGAVLASMDVDGRTNEITRFTPLLDQVNQP